jgi:phenylacetate-coenzyme A ligase PaaK-like adenylate-forming protein
VGRILVTSLHSYATPFIRYDIGDVGTLLDSCPCGHHGPVLSHIYGRAKSFVKHADGTETMFFLRGKEMTAIARLDEYRIRQTGFQNIVVEIGGRESLSLAESSALAALVKEHAGEEFAVEIKATPKIDWGHGVKRLGFACEI